MKGKDTTVEELIAALQKMPPKAIVRVAVTHDIDCELVKRGPVLDCRKRGKLVILDVSDDCSHGFGDGSKGGV